MSEILIPIWLSSNPAIQQTGKLKCQLFIPQPAVVITDLTIFNYTYHLISTASAGINGHGKIHSTPLNKPVCTFLKNKNQKAFPFFILQQVFDDRSRDGGALGWRLKGGRGRGVEHLIPVFAKGQLEAELHIYIKYVEYSYILFLNDL